MTTWKVRNLVAAAAVGLLSVPAAAIAPDQVDDFEDQSTAGWVEGPASPNPPTVVASGGPAGANDAYLRNVASGSGGAGGRMAMFNQAQWTGDYAAAGVERITADLANFGPTPLFIRVVVAGPDLNINFASTEAFVLPADGVWRPATFDLTTDALTALGHLTPLTTTLADVVELRLISAAQDPQQIGDVVDGTLGVDNIRAAAVPEPVSLALTAGAVLMLALRRPGAGRRTR